MRTFLDQPFFEHSDLSFLKKRDDYDIPGCVSCPVSPPPCNCNSQQSCTLIHGTCDKCAYNQCVDNQTQGSTKNIGGIVGGVVGGVGFIILIVGFIVWSHQKKKRSNRFLRLEAQDKEILGEEGDEDDEDGYHDEDSPTAKFVPRVQIGSDSIALANLANRNYENFNSKGRAVKNNSDVSENTITSPTASTGSSKKNNRKSMASPQPSSSYSISGSKYKGRRASSYRNSTQTMTSIATSALSRASNIIPIAYIPGVKAKSNSTLINNRLIRDDYINEEDADDYESDKNIARQKTFVGSPLSTTTAVRAVPKLVDVQKKTTLSQVINSYADDDSFTTGTREDDMSSLTSAETLRKNNMSLKALNDKQSKEQKNRLSSHGLTHIIEEYDNDGQSDLISIGSNSDGDEDYYTTSNKRNTIRSFMSSSSRPSSGLLNSSEVRINPFDDENQL